MKSVKLECHDNIRFKLKAWDVWTRESMREKVYAIQIKGRQNRG